MKGVLLVDKPAGMTSHDVVDRVRRAAQMQRVGHTGTLDPGATGLLVLCLGNATRLAQYLTDTDKTYEGTMRFGITTESYDLDGKVVAERPVPPLTGTDIRRVMEDFTGDIEQLPPMVSAVKVGGQRLYKMARKGQEVERPPRRVMVHEFTLLGYDAPDARIRVRCSRGTYVRTLCHDIGETLQCGAALANLRRTQVGKHRIEDAVSLDALTSPDDVRQHLIGVDDVLDLPEVIVPDASRRVVASGGSLFRMHVTCEFPVSEGTVQIKSETGKLLALGEVQCSPQGAFVQPKRVFSGNT